jgi:Protein of unknown function (DUF1501)
MRLNRRISLLGQIERHFETVARTRPVGMYDTFQEQAFDLLTSGRVQRAFALQEEPDKVRDRYTRTQWGQCLLLARRLIETGVRLVHVNWCREPGDSAVDNPLWDTHAQNADQLEDVLCPMFDVGFTALIEDLEQRGLLHETLVIAIGEFGRTPKINGAAGRDHWGHVFSFALAGAGICTGQVYGSSDRDGAYPARDAVTGGDLTATLFHALGIDPESTFRDPEGRDHRLTLGTPIRPLLGAGVATYERVAAEGSVRADGFDTSLLLNTEFQDPVPLFRVDRGSRPKGWRASPILAAHDGGFGVRLEESAGSGVRGSESKHKGAQHVSIGIGASGAAATVVQKRDRAVLGQEMRNPRAGRFTFTVEACLLGASRELCELFAKQFACRLVIYRFADAEKNPLKRQELGTLTFQPPIVLSDRPTWGTFELNQIVDSAGPGMNVNIGHGLGVAIDVEKTADGTLEWSSAADKKRSGAVSLRIRSAQLHFACRTVNDKIVV